MSQYVCSECGLLERSEVSSVEVRVLQIDTQYRNEVFTPRLEFISDALSMVPMSIRKPPPRRLRQIICLL